MESITLGYSNGLVIQNCESAWDESVASGVTSTLETATYYKVGRGAAKLVVAAGATTGLLATKAVYPSKTIDDCTGIKFWFRSSFDHSAADLALVLSTTASCATETLVLNFPAVTKDTWVQITLAVADPSALVDIVSIGLKMLVDRAFTCYIDDVQAVLPTKAYDVLSLKGFNDPESAAMWPGLSEQLTDGSVRNIVNGFRRVITVDFGVILTKADRLFLFRWLLRTDIQRITYSTEDVDVIVVDPAGIDMEWKDASFAKAFVLECAEKSVRRSIPTSWKS